MAELNIWWRLPLGQIINGLRPLRDPKGRPLALDTSTPCGTGGVVQMDREVSYCPFSREARHTRWRAHFHEGRTISAEHGRRFVEFGVEHESEINPGEVLEHGMPFATHRLPVIVRSDSDCEQDEAELAFASDDFEVV